MKVKILLEPGESREDVKELLFKALESQQPTEAHEDNFEDPVMEAAAEEMKQAYVQLNREMIQEIEELLDRDVGDDY